ncbi:hypothetical protein MKI84_09185 [Ancylobacter sp. A5.8]|uniref:hypothetical protein n=1 Tax=Ancylobacter gelatini TaxID=2919920 RepID=UPI001F4E390E|nr:hypothetical protein [Ancylobacter gelatini]MCJ8143091.1 hypothetical protein [Ancylobacter gelatini]
MLFSVRLLSALVIGGFVLTATASVPVFAQTTNGEQKPAEQSPEEQAKEAQRRSIEEFNQAAKLPGNAGLPECVWSGRRIAMLLWRDDIDTARRHLELYERFGCPTEHLKIAFRCLVRQGNIDSKAQERLSERVHMCWVNPDSTPPVPAQAPPAPAQ